MFQLTEGGLSRVIATVDTRHLTDVLRGLIEGSALITLSHQDVLILIFGALQFGPAFHDLILRDSPVEPSYNLTFLYALSHLNAQHDNLCVDATGDGHL